MANCSHTGAELVSAVPGRVAAVCASASSLSGRKGDGCPASVLPNTCSKGCAGSPCTARGRVPITCLPLRHRACTAACCWTHAAACVLTPRTLLGPCCECREVQPDWAAPQAMRIPEPGVEVAFTATLGLNSTSQTVLNKKEAPDINSL